jgi:lipoprotein-anchoring transpeptidase ErfK/SrfK
MSGSDGQPDYYFLEDVPWTMYFHGAYALHGAYWHDRFGKVHSHGCVNLSLADAKWLFDWTSPAGRTGWSRATEEDLGTWVWVHE